MYLLLEFSCRETIFRRIDCSHCNSTGSIRQMTTVHLDLMAYNYQHASIYYILNTNACRGPKQDTNVVRPLVSLTSLKATMCNFIYSSYFCSYAFFLSASYLNTSPPLRQHGRLSHTIKELHMEPMFNSINVWIYCVQNVSLETGTLKTFFWTSSVICNIRLFSMPPCGRSFRACGDQKTNQNDIMRST